MGHKFSAIGQDEKTNSVQENIYAELKLKGTAEDIDSMIQNQKNPTPENKNSKLQNSLEKEGSRCDSRANDSLRISNFSPTNCSRIDEDTDVIGMKKQSTN